MPKCDLEYPELVLTLNDQDRPDGMATTNQQKVPTMPKCDLAYPELVPILNGHGYMVTSLDPVSLAFVDYASSLDVKENKGSALEIGAAYGVAAIPAVLKGCRSYIANDSCEEHLLILQQRIPEHLRQFLILKTGFFPDDFDSSFTGRIGAVLVSRVLDLFDTDSLQKAIAKLSTILQSGGKAFIITQTPYRGGTVEGFIQMYEQRVRDGHLWPGWIEDFRKVDTLKKGHNLPQSVHFMDPTVLQREFEAKGFRVEKAEFMKADSFPASLQLDGRELVGLIAVKP
jgi:hypothetical protein